MATNWSAYEAAVELYGNNKENIAEIGSRYPLFTRTVCLANDEMLLDILKAIPKVTARVVETGLKDMEVETEVTETPEINMPEPDEKEQPKKEKKAKAKKAEKTEEKEAEATEEDSYDGKTSKELYAMCCERGISNKVASRKKADLIEALKKYDKGEFNEEVEEDADDEWDAEPEEAKDPYEGKSAKELYKMCMDRKIKTKPRLSADKYAELLRKEDAKKADPEIEEEDDDDDDWEI